jgi:hypothetical protein
MEFKYYRNGLLVVVAIFFRQPETDSGMQEH